MHLNHTVRIAIGINTLIEEDDQPVSAWIAPVLMFSMWLPTWLYHLSTHLLTVIKHEIREWLWTSRASLLVFACWFRLKNPAVVAANWSC